MKLWGLDFGDLHKSLHAHDDSVTSVKFVPGSHYFFTTSKDKMVKYWDGDSREMVMAMPAHHAEVWGVAVSHVCQRATGCMPVEWACMNIEPSCSRSSAPAEPEMLAAVARLMWACACNAR